MITDPEEPGYRYPDVGERLWHVPLQTWVVVIEAPPTVNYDLRIISEVPARREDDGARLIVKLRSLETGRYEPCERCGTAIELRDPQPPAEPRHGLPLGAAIWDEAWRNLGNRLVRDWHSPARCDAARAARLALVEER
jgi:hypothetical protein